jgi:hypothetical protein
MLQLLFFDTFSHDGAVNGAAPELNLDLVQFPSPVYVSEVRVIPLGSRVTANFPGGVRLGATNPSTFQLEFFVNNLKAPGASTFESIGTLQYSSSSCIALPIGRDIATDGLVLRGHYSTITLAVYGAVSDATPDQLARQGGEVKTKELEAVDEVVLPSTPVGESYAAQWTEKHKQVALKAEPPEGWPQELGPAEGRRPAVRPEGEAGSPRSGDRTSQWKKYSEGTEGAWERNGARSPPLERPRTEHRDLRDTSSPAPARGRERTPRSRDGSRDGSSRSSRRSPSRDGKRPVGRPGRSRSRSRTPELVLHYSKSREASLERSGGRYRSPSREPLGRRDSRDRDAWRRTSREGDYDRTSLHSSGSRRLSPLGRGPRASQSPGRRSSSRRTRSRSHGRRSLGSPQSSRPQSQARGNGCPRSPEAPAAGGPAPASPPPREDILDNVSDISDGDIPDLPEAEVEEAPQEQMEATPSSREEDDHSARTSVVREDVEEISDEEAEWSDDVEAAALSDIEAELGEGINWEQFDRETIQVFDPAEWSAGPELGTLCCPTESAWDRVRLGKAEAGDGPALEALLAALAGLPMDERWVEGLEAVSRTVQTQLPAAGDQPAAVESLARLALLATDFSAAMEQPRPTHKVRHIKSGLRLVVELLGCGPCLRLELLAGGLQARLLSLLTRDHMATSIKLLILRTLDCTLDCAKGIASFLDCDGYSQLVALAGSGLQSRTKFGLASLLTKCHLSELLGLLEAAASRLGDVMNGGTTELVAVNGHSGLMDTEEVAQCLDQVRTIYLDLEHCLSHPARHLPSLSHSDLSDTDFGSPASGYFLLARSHGLLETVALLLAHPATSGPVAGAARRLVAAWLGSQPGLLFLAASPAAGGLVTALLHQQGPEGESVNIMTQVQFLMLQVRPPAACWARSWCTC